MYRSLSTCSVQWGRGSSLISRSSKTAQQPMLIFTVFHPLNSHFFLQWPWKQHSAIYRQLSRLILNWNKFKGTLNSRPVVIKQRELGPFVSHLLTVGQQVYNYHFSKVTSKSQTAMLSVSTPLHQQKPASQQSLICRVGPIRKYSSTGHLSVAAFFCLR